MKYIPYIISLFIVFQGYTQEAIEIVRYNFVNEGQLEEWQDFYMKEARSNYDKYKVFDHFVFSDSINQFELFKVDSSTFQLLGPYEGKYTCKTKADSIIYFEFINAVTLEDITEEISFLSCYRHGKWINYNENTISYYSYGQKDSIWIQYFLSPEYVNIETDYRNKPYRADTLNLSMLNNLNKIDSVLESKTWELYQRHKGDVSYNINGHPTFHAKAKAPSSFDSIKSKRRIKFDLDLYGSFNFNNQKHEVTIFDDAKESDLRTYKYKLEKHNSELYLVIGKKKIFKIIYMNKSVIVFERSNVTFK